MDAGTPGDGVPGDGAARPPGRGQAGHHPEESRGIEGRRPIHAHGAPAPEDHPFGREGPCGHRGLVLPGGEGIEILPGDRRCPAGSRRGHGVDHRPVGQMLGAQYVRGAVPRGGDQVLGGRPRPARRDLRARRDDGQERGILGLRARVVCLAVEAEEPGQRGWLGVFEQAERPAQGGGGEAQGSERVTDVVLAITEGALAVLPCLAPGDGRQAHEERARRARGHRVRPAPGVEIGAALEAVVLRCVVVEAREIMDRIERRQQRVSLGGVQVAARWIGPQRPGGVAELFPRRQRECVPEKQGNRVDREGLRLHAVGGIEPRERQGAPGRGQGEADPRRPVMAPERIGLRGPVHVPERGRESVGMVLGPLVVPDHDLVVR